jgi:hypothetical protein
MRAHTLLLSLVLSLTLFAQSPEAFNYQAVARDVAGEPIAGSSVGVQFQLHQTSAAGTVVYAETHATTTNAQGVFSLAVGTGTPTTGNFSGIDWNAGPYFLEVGLDPSGGTSYVSTGTQQLLSVPYALHAGSVTCPTVSFSGDTVYYGGGCYLILAGASALNGGCADNDGDGYFDQAGCGTPVDCDDTDGAINPGATEVCDGVDNNCDNQVDESDPNEGQGCVTGLPGACGAGILVCQGGSLVCQPLNSPTTEICDGIDNDCDGVVDEGLPLVSYWPDLDNDTYGDQFAAPVSTCDGPPAGNWSTNNLDCNDLDLGINPDATEVCDGVDNDCNGAIDDGTAGVGGSCNTGLPGVCATGVLVCQNGTLVCQPINSPSVEVCDGIDNDCDGAVDEGNPGGGGSCNTGLAGVCASGTLQCQNGTLVCVPDNSPSAEVCGDGLDNDCDGAVDEGCFCPTFTVMVTAADPGFVVQSGPTELTISSSFGEFLSTPLVWLQDQAVPGPPIPLSNVVFLSNFEIKATVPAGLVFSVYDLIVENPDGSCGLLSGAVTVVSSLADGFACTINVECSSGNCTEGVCCDTPCANICTSCLGVNTGGIDGQCGNVLAGTDPYGQCFPYLCNGAGGCYTTSSGPSGPCSGCAPGYTCGPGQTCVPI